MSRSPEHTGGKTTGITSRDRVIFPGSGQTKGHLADYYEAVAPLMLPFAADRPVSLVRCPQGIGGKCFFQKHDKGALGPHVRHVPITEKNGETENYPYLTDAAGLLECVQMGAVEFHGWGAQASDVERPDRLIFDLDPDEGLDFVICQKAAQHIRIELGDLGLTSFALLSGGKGIHVVVPLRRGHGWDAHKDFAKGFAETMSRNAPERYVATMSKARRKGRVFIDWLRNQRGNTAILPYSARARAGAPVAVPVAWEDLDGMDNAHPFSIDDAATLIARAKALRGWGNADQPLPGF